MENDMNPTPAADDVQPAEGNEEEAAAPAAPAEGEAAAE
jgi:hypothetical protein